MDAFFIAFRTIKEFVVFCRNVKSESLKLGENMNKFAVNLSTIFTQVPFIDRFKKASEQQFSYVECQFPYELTVDQIKQQLRENNLSMVLLNLPPGNWANGDRGLAIDPFRTEEFKNSVDVGIEYASALNIPNIHCMAGVCSDNIPSHKVKEVYIKNITYAAKKLATHELTLLIEPINQKDIPNYYLSSIKEAAEILQEVNLPNVKLQFDFYHMQKIQGDLISTFENYFDQIGHVQIADVPGRHQPGTGEINYKNVLSFLDKVGYNGYIGLEYTPLGKSEDSFKWIK